MSILAYLSIVQLFWRYRIPALQLVKYDPVDYYHMLRISRDILQSKPSNLVQYNTN